MRQITNTKYRLPVRAAALVACSMAVTSAAAAPKLPPAATNTPSAAALRRAGVDPAQADKIEETMRLRALQNRGRSSGAPQSGVPAIINGGQPLPGPAAGQPSKSSTRKSAEERRAQARQQKEERKREMKAQADRKKAEKKLSDAKKAAEKKDAARAAVENPVKMDAADKDAD